jgi:uncharacterized protein
MAGVSTEPDAAEIRVLGALLEKQHTTPEAYPLSVNALRLACNQSTARDPVVDYDDHTVLDALERLSRRRWVRLTSGAGSRARKYRHLLGDALDLPEDQLALLCVLMLRGPQTPGELKQRSDRLHPFPGLGAIEQTLDDLVGRELAARLPRRPGQKEQRYVQLLGGDSDDAGELPPPDEEPAQSASGGPDRLDRIEAELAELRDQVAALRRELGG